MQEKEKMFLELNSVLVRFWIENGRPDREVKIELLERMLNWYKKMGYVTLDKQEEKKLPEGLEEAAEEFAKTTFTQPFSEHPDKIITIVEPDKYAGFIAGAEWQRKQDQSLIELAEDHAMLAGMNKMEQQMMEKAVETQILTTSFINLPKEYLHQNGIQAGDKVRVIVIPNTDEK